MIHISIEEFSRNARSMVDRVAREGETVVIERDGDTLALLKPPATSRRSERRKSAADYEAARSAAGSWKDVDVDEFLEGVYESRRIPPRPAIDL